MKNIQESKLNMYFAVIRVCQENADVLNQIPIAAPVLLEFQQTVEKLQEAARAQELDFKGITQEKNKLREAMIQQAYLLGQTLSAYAYIQGDAELEETVNYNESVLQRSPDTVVKEMCEIILQKARENAQGLDADLQIGQTEINQLDDLITAFAQTIGSPRVAIIERKYATSSIRELIKTADNILRWKLDRIVVKFRGSAFYMKYISSRRIIDRVRSRSKGEPLNPESEVELQ